MNGFSPTTADSLPGRGAAARPQALERVAHRRTVRRRHTDPTLTMRVYQQVLDMGGAAVEQLERVLGCTIQEAFVTYSGREGLGTQWTRGPKSPRRAAASSTADTPFEAL